MKASKIFSNRSKAISAHRASNACAAAVLAVLIGLSWSLAISRAQQPGNDVAGAQVLTRGPVHEAFAGMVTFNPEPGIVVTKSPPAVIEEMPPEERPEGDNVTWIPGYWAWDDERSDFLWVSGTWRALPPGRQWMAGYWGQTSQGYQWTSGYWADASTQETTYLPPPPATVEAGPNIPAPSLDYGWSPGCWMWYQGRYAWRPGYWAQGRADWDWCPAHYVWTPRGCIFVGGFWDYPVARRGVLFAPVYFDAGVYARRGYFYSPRIVIDLDVFSAYLFLRPRYQHYYFGDYYAASYVQGGFYASFSFQSSRYGYDPIYSHQRWEHRRDREWEHRVATSYEYRRDHETARPPRTWADQRRINPGTTEFRQNRVVVATSIHQLATRRDGPVRFQPVAKAERQQLAQRGQEVQKSREQRRTLEARPVTTTARTSGAVVEPTKAKLTRSPIVAKPVSQLGRNQAPPKAQQAPKPDPKFQPKAETRTRPRSEPPVRQPAVDRSNPKPEPRRLEPEKRPARDEVSARETKLPVRSEAAPREPKAQQAPQPRVKEAKAKSPEVPPPTAKGLEPKVKRLPEKPAKGRPAVNKKGAMKSRRPLWFSFGLTHPWPPGSG
jgi:WXXGXW repeat (2 copies)